MNLCLFRTFRTFACACGYDQTKAEASLAKSCDLVKTKVQKLRSKADNKTTSVFDILNDDALIDELYQAVDDRDER